MSCTSRCEPVSFPAIPVRARQLPVSRNPASLRLGFRALGILLFTASLALAADPPRNPDFTAGDAIPDGATHDWNLGPTGLRGWMFSERMETTAARQVAVTEVDPGSPAEGLFAVGDVLLGVAGERFSVDPRLEIGRAITEAEGRRGKLTFIRWRDGETEKVTVRIAPLGKYASTAPFNCEKSERILAEGCAALARRMEAKPNAGNWIVRSYNALALLASGNPEYLPVVRQQVAAVSSYTDPERRDYHSWFYGPINLLLAEYTIATGDETYLPALERVTMEIVRGQSTVGSWGHRFVQENGRLAGYGMMNAPGLPLATSLVLAREAGVESTALDLAIERTARLVRFYVGKGSVPYGDHHPWIEAHDDNGKNGIAALFFHLLGDVEAATYFSRMSLASHGAERDHGHTGNFFNMLWAMPGVALSGPRASGAWMEEFGWSYDLARRWDGTFIHQGPPQWRHDSYRRWDATGLYLLAYAQSVGKIHLAGHDGSIVEKLGRKEAESVVAVGRGWSSARKDVVYADRSTAEVLTLLRSWSPVIRERAAKELARRQAEVGDALLALLGAKDRESKLGACLALRERGQGSEAAVARLRALLRTDDLWLRVRAAEALAAAGEAGRVAIPDLLALLAAPPDESDPRAMVQRYLCFALFDRRDGLFGRSLEGVDREALYRAVRAGLGNEDGRARGTLVTVFRLLRTEELAPLLPDILRAVREPAPSGIMFADGVRLGGLEVLAKHRIAEGLPWCLDLIDPDRWGMRERVRPCLAALRLYGGAAKSEIPRLRELPEKLREKRWKPEEIEKLGIPALIEEVEGAPAVDLRPIGEVGPPKERAGSAGDAGSQRRAD